ncbi:hypothetical protein GCM10027098_13830 [Bowmanella dokdonensis]
MLVLPIHERDKPPLAYLQNGQHTGIYTELFRAVLEGAGIPFRFIPTPSKRNQRMFLQGKIPMACCVNPAWYMEPEEQLVQVFSDPLYVTRDLFVFPPGKAFDVDRTDAFKDKRVALVLGYGYLGEQAFVDRIDLLNEEAVLGFLALGRADVAIVNEHILDYWLSQHPGEVERGPVHDRATLHIQLHRNWIHLLESLNQAINDLIQDGARDRIVQSFLHEGAPDNE